MSLAVQSSMSPRVSLALASFGFVACAGMTTDESAFSTAQPPPSIVATATVIAAGAGRVAWSPVDAHSIAFDAVTPSRTANCTDGMCFDIYVSADDGGSRRCVTCGRLDDIARPLRG